MSLSTAPWLDGLDGTSTWKPKQPLQQPTAPSSVTHNASSLVNKQTRIPRRSTSGSPYTSIRKTRSPLAPLDKNENSFRKEDDLCSEQDGSMIIRGTVQLRAKSSSPGKKEASLEWRKRLLNGKIGYGDQTDLFGPSGLDNIFVGNPKEPRSEGGGRSGNLSWLPRSDAAMPSSPPPWPSNLRTAAGTRFMELKLSSEDRVEHTESQEVQEEDQEQQDSSVVSNPFQLETSSVVRSDRVTDASQAQMGHARIVSGVDRTVSGPTMLEQEDFSPVILSRHTTVSGTIDYSPLKSHQSPSNDEDKLAKGQRNSSIEDQPRILVEDIAGTRQEQSIFTDGPSSALEVPQTYDLSLSENLPTGTPEPLDHNVQVNRGGYSTLGSFRHRLLSADPSAVSGMLPEDTSDALPPAPSPPRLLAGTDVAKVADLSADGSQISERAQTPVRASMKASFGDGELDSHTFEATVEVATPSMPKDAEQDSDGSPGSDILVPGSKIPAGFQAQKFDGQLSLRSIRSDIKRSYPRLPSKAEQTPYPKATLLSKRSRPDNEQEDRSHSHAEHKRPPASPLKISTPKRRRTLHASEMFDKTREASAVMQSGIADASHNELVEHAGAGPNAAAVRPPNPTPLHHTSESVILPADLQEATDDFLAQEDRNTVEEVLDMIEQSMSEADPETIREQAEGVAAEVAKYTIKISKSAESDGHGERKRSVTTQDFFREAELVMEYIRARAAKKPSLLASVEETENMEDDISQDTNLQLPKGLTRSNEYMRVSREPSRENRPGSRWREPEQLRVQREVVNIDRVSSQLRKWQEPDLNDEQDSFLAGPDPDEINVEDSGAHHSSSEIVYDERARIRITGPSSEFACQVNDGGSQQNSQRSAQSSENSTRRTDNVGTLAPDAVAHLIGSEVGGMTFDREKQKWVRLRSPEHRAVRNGFLDVLESHLTSEDDPFREISDLVVDEGTEQRRISSPARLSTIDKPQPDKQVLSRETSTQAMQNFKKLSTSMTVLRHQLDASSTISSSKGLSVTGEEGASSKDGSNPQPTHITQQKTTSKQSRPPTLTQSKVMHVIKDAESLAEVSKMLCHADDAFNDGKNTSTSAPEAGLLSRLRDDTAPEEEITDLRDLQSPRPRPNAPSALLTSQPVLTPALPHPLLSQAACTDARDVSELSFVAPLPGDRVVSVSLSVSKPGQSMQKQLSRIVEQESSPLRYQSSLMLSDLPDFTFHQEDHEQTSERALAKRFAKYAATEVNDRFAVATKELVRALTDLYPEEPFWQQLHDLDMRGRSLTSLHGLDNFCDNVRGLDISRNELTHLNGVPASVRRLAATNNHLTSLTSFVHLSNLQHINVSSNGLTSLAGFSHCPHLRELVADDNDISSLEGIAHLDLLKLRCRRNRIQRLHLHAGDLAQLVDLDLSNCGIESIIGLEHLHCLESLTLDGSRFSEALEFPIPLPSLNHLHLRDCNLSQLDVSLLPNLRTLNVDDNALSSIKGLDKLPLLDTLSMKRQHLAAAQHVDIFNQRLEARTILLSGNKLPKLYVGVDQLSLKHLELAAVGLVDLPAELGVRMPNLRTLNLNYNSIKDVKPLLHMHALQDLQVYGNRMGRLRKTAAILSKLPNLRHVDCRDNPLSQGFYAPVSMVSSHTTTALEIRERVLDPVDEDQQHEELEWKLYNVHPQDAERDQKHVDRLDEETNLRRRVYGMLMAHSCPALQELDGLPFVKASALRKDLIWHRLIELGVVKKART